VECGIERGPWSEELRGSWRLMGPFSTLLYCTLLYSTLLYSTLLYYTLLYSTPLYSTLLYSTLQTRLYSSLPKKPECGNTALIVPSRPEEHFASIPFQSLSSTAVTALHCTALQCTALYCTALHCTDTMCHGCTTAIFPSVVRGAKHLGQRVMGNID
jgi:hypothetical protein